MKQVVGNVGTKAGYDRHYYSMLANCDDLVQYYMYIVYSQAEWNFIM
jgi:hypothetical protein